MENAKREGEWDKKKLFIESIIAIGCAIIGVIFGKASNTYYYNGQKISEAELNEIMQQNSEYNLVIKDNEILSAKFTAMENENKTYKEKINELTEANETMNKKLNEIPSIDFSDLGFFIDGVEQTINKKHSLVIIDGIQYFSKDFINSLLSESKELIIKDDNVYIGRIISEKCNLFEKWIVDSAGCEMLDTATDSYGNKHSNVLFFNRPSCYCTYNLESKYSFLRFSIAPNKNRATSGGADITIKLDGNVVYSTEITKTTEIVTKELPINNCSLLTIECQDNRYIPALQCVSNCMFFDAELYN